MDEDEGFSDWTQRRERQRQQRLQELSHGGDEDDEEEESTISKAAPVKTLRASVTSSSQIQKQEQGEMNRARMETEKRNKEAEEAVQAEKARLEKQKEDEVKREEMITRRREEAQRPKTEVRILLFSLCANILLKKCLKLLNTTSPQFFFCLQEKRKEIKVSYTSKVFLHQEPKLINTDGAAATEEVAPHVSKTKRSTRFVEIVVCVQVFLCIFGIRLPGNCKLTMVSLGVVL